MNGLRTRYFAGLCASVFFCTLASALAEEATTNDANDLKAKGISVRGIAKKMQATPGRYPRRPGMPQKRPLGS